MDFKIDKHVMLDALGPVVDVSDPANAHQACAMAAIEAGAGGLRLRGTRLEQYATVHVDAAVKRDGAACAMAKHLRDAIAKMPAGDVRIAESKGGVEISSGKTRVRLPATGTDDYPLTPAPDDAEWIEVPADALKSALSVSYAACTDSTRANIYGVRLEIEDGARVVRGIAAESARFAVSEPRVESPISGAIECTVPLPALKPIAGAIAKVAAVRLCLRGPVLHIEIDEGGRRVLMAAKVADQAFVPWRTVVKSTAKHASIVRVARTLLADALDRVSMATTTSEKSEKGGGATPVGATFSVVNGSLRVTASSSKVGEVHDEIAVDLEGPQPEPIGISPTYLAQALRQHSDDVVTLLFGSPTDPVVMRSEGALCLVMPVRLD